MSSVYFRRSLDGIQSLEAEVLVITNHTILGLVQLMNGVLIAALCEDSTGNIHVIMSLDGGQTWGIMGVDGIMAIGTYVVVDNVVSVIPWSGCLTSEYTGRLVLSAEDSSTWELCLV